MQETFDHTADIGIRGVGRNPEQAFSEAARALFGVIADVAGLKKRTDMSFPVSCEAATREDLFVDFLNSLLTQAALRKCVLTDVRLERMDEKSLNATVYGVRSGPKTVLKLRTEVKGATYCQLKVARRGRAGKWTAQCVVDV